MNKSTLIKICGVTDANIAAAAARAGANYIGIIFHPNSPRHVDLALAKEIASASSENGAKPVAVFTQHNAMVMKNICENTQINVVQLHGARSRAEHPYLPIEFERIYVRQLFKDGSMVSALNQGLKQCDATRDMVLFDNIQPGSGETIDWHLFKYKGSLPFGVAGGLTADNITRIISLVKPTLVDVSSGVEDAPGKKNISAIEHFIQQVRQLEASRYE